LQVRDELGRQWQPLLRRSIEAATAATDRGVAAQLRFQGILLVSQIVKSN